MRCKLSFKLLLMLLMVTSCYEPKEGCTDVLATNYEASADEACENDCCTFPQLKLTVSHKHGNATFSFDSVYINDLGQAYSFKFIQLYLYNARLIDDNGQSVPIHQEVLLNPGQNNEQSIIDDLISFQPRNFRYEFGEWIGSGSFTELKFNIGIPPEIDTSSFVTQASHPINTLGDSLIIDETRYSPLYISLDSVPGRSYFNVKLLEEIQISIVADKLIERGFDVTYELEVDYAKCFQSVDFDASTDEIRLQLREGAKNLFVLR